MKNSLKCLYNKKILLFFSGLFFILVLFFLKHYLSIFYFQNDLNKVAINIEAQKISNPPLICFEDECDIMSYQNDIYSYKLNQENPIFYIRPVKNIEIVLNQKNDYLKIKNISIFNGKEFNYYKQNTLKFNQIDFNGSIKTSTILNIDNNKTLFQKIGIYIESIFYNWYFYIFSYILILIYLIKYPIKNNIKTNYILISILFLATVLRLSHIDYIPFWNDELYTITVISENGKNIFKNIFYDPGNPPLFFLISNIWLHFFNKSVFLIRLLPLLIGVSLIYLIYFTINKILNKKTALFASFLSAINIFLITESNEIRSYILTMLLIMASIYILDRLYLNYSNKNLIFYTIISVLLINTHYYAVLVVIFNFILGIYLLKEKKKFILANLASFLSFLPYFIHSYQISLQENFNAWIEKPSFSVLHNHILFYFGNIFWFLLVITFCFFIFKKYLKNSKEGKIFLYNISLIGFVFIAVLLISFIKPILFERYFCIFIPLLIINTAILLNIEYNKKFNYIILTIILLISINIPKYENFNLFSNIDTLIKYSNSDSEFNKNKNTYFIIPDNPKYIKYYKNFNNIKKDNIIVSLDGVNEHIDLLEKYRNKTKEKNNLILYIPEICINSKIKYSKDKNIQKIDTSILPIYKVNLE